MDAGPPLDLSQAPRHVRRVGKGARSGSVAQPPTPAGIGDEAARLRDALLDDAKREQADFHAIGDRLAALLPLGGGPRDHLTRVLGVPPRLALRWVQETIGLLRAAPAAEVEVEVDRAVLVRLDVLAWAWGPIPEAWTPRKEQQQLDAWAGELRPRRPAP